MPNTVTALLVMPPERRSRLMDEFEGIEANIRCASSCDETAALLRDDPDTALVLTDLCLPDGSWFDVLNLVSETHPGANVVVCARVADELFWTKVLEAGGYDVLVEPYEENEVSRILNAAVHARPQHRLATAS